ncbi:alcohol dehydrogenase GroES domain protein [Trametes versicolor FP-101664 SS1]|uniref:alcohol dehydrogenase GroES domain protein n=1 Tax=Trametes versicolor (strain FP-101664) TaxID=717944 RepID=UPI00046223AA|nr:alcohol dehydrogenase GroES domain protein [Trametes versicolor FP-101664 SS1]EIW53227.1 alcohol dehydrogenase GroES domain protein [Trametes versicolor FP-101664 SS1]
MRAIRYYGPADIRLDEVPEPTPGEGQVKIKVAWCGICGSDLHSWHEILPVSPTTTQPHPVTHETLPVVMGHEFSGTVVELGPGVDPAGVAVGEHVVVEPILSCMQASCPFCSAGARNLCRNLTFIGIGGLGGGLSEYICVERRLVFPLPPKVPLDVGAMMEPLSIAWHAVKRSNFKAGDSVLILGAGPIGLLTLRVVHALGATWIGVSEPALKRRELALQNGATAVFDPTSRAVDLVAETLNATSQRGADVVFDCAGNQRTLDTAFVAVRPRGSIMNIAVWGTRPSLDIGSLTAKEVSLSSVLGCDRVHAEMLDAVADGRFPVDGLESLVTRRIPLEDLVEKGIKALLHETDKHVKILVYPDLKPTASGAKM